MNPMDLYKVLQYKSQFEERHPKAVAFIEKELMGEFPEGTVIEMSLTRPGNPTVTTNLKVSAEDLEMVAALKEIMAKNK